MVSAEKVLPKVPIGKRNLVKSVNGIHFLTNLGHRWQELSLMEQIITNHEDPETSFSASLEYMEYIRGRREKLLAELPGGNDPESRGRTFSILRTYKFFPWQINHLPPAGVIFPPK